MHMIMMVTGVPPEHIQQGAEVVLGETPDKAMVMGIPPWHAQSMVLNPFNMLPHGRSFSVLGKLVVHRPATFGTPILDIVLPAY